MLALAVLGGEGVRQTVLVRPAQEAGATAPAVPMAAAAPLPVGAPLVLVERATARLPVPPGAPSAHAASLAWRVAPGAPPASGELIAVWWAGSRESGPDVRVYLSTLGASGWSEPRAIADRARLAQALGFAVRRIGNAVLHPARDGRLHLFVVATGLGGWAAARVVHLVAADTRADFVVQRVLPLTPLANTSVLVRAQTLERAAGGWWLPAYFELGLKQPWLLGFDANGRFESIVRVGRATTSLQPTLLPLRDGALLAFMRDHGPERRIQWAESTDAGRHWVDRPPLPIGNHDTAVAALTLFDPSASSDPRGRTVIGHLLAHNDTSTPGDTPRSVLRLQVSADGRQWTPGPVIQRAEPGAEFSYPNLLQVGRKVHAVYTHRREGIGHVVFEIESPGGASTR